MTDLNKESQEQEVQIQETAALDSVKTKTVSVAEIIKKMEGASGEDITKLKDVLGQIGNEANNLPARANAAANKASVKMTKEDLATIFGDSLNEQSEDFLEQISTLFEAAVAIRVAEVREEIMEEAAQLMEEELAEIEGQLLESLDQYLDEAVTEWLKENELAIESTVKVEQFESLVEGIRELFLDHDIDIPEESLDLVDQLSEQNEKLKEELNEALNAKLELEEIVSEARKEMAFDEESEGLAATQVEKLRTLSEGISFVDMDDYRKKVALIREAHFGNAKNLDTNTNSLNEDVTLETQVHQEEKKVNPAMANYVNAISSTIKRNN